MNRRQVLQAMGLACSAAGVPHVGELSVYGGERKPMLAVIHSAKTLPASAVEAIRGQWEALRKLSPELPPCVVLDKDLKLEMFETVSPEVK